MALILTFLGKGGTGRTTLAIATAKRFASQGQRVLLAGQDSGPALGLLLGVPLSHDPQAIAPNFHAVLLQTAPLVERGWEELKKLEAQYVRTPFFKDVYGQELGVLPGMDSLATMNAIRLYDSGGNYDVIIYDGMASQETLRMLGAPEIMRWYVRRFRAVIANSDLGRALSPFIQPVSAAVFNVDWSNNNFSEPVQQFDDLLSTATAAVTNPRRMIAYLVTTPDPIAVATARYLWGSSQQVGLTVGGVIVNQGSEADLTREFIPLPVSVVPKMTDNWEPVMAALPDFRVGSGVPAPITINPTDSTVTLFLPGFDKKQVKLTQYGPEVTIEAGDQRRNILLPPGLSGKPVTGAKFQNNCLIISF